MPQKLRWTDQADEHLRRRRADAASWDIIAGELGISRNAAIERARTIGARIARLPPPPPDEFADPDRPALPAGHPATWGAICHGTCLAGADWPGPSEFAPREMRPLLLAAE